MLNISLSSINYIEISLTCHSLFSAEFYTYRDSIYLQYKPKVFLKAIKLKPILMTNSSTCRMTGKREVQRASQRNN